MAVSIAEIDSVHKNLDNEAVDTRECVLSKLRSPVRKALFSKYISIDQEEASPALSEYYGVALAFTALGTLIRRMNDRKALQGPVKRKVHKSVLNLLVKKAMERLRGIACKAQKLEDRLKEENALSVEHVELRRQLAEAQGGVIEMKKRRDEDARANEKVLAMFSTQEQLWKNERRRLKGEIVNLRKELAECIGGLEIGNGKHGMPGMHLSCLECKKRDLVISGLKSEVKEKDFLMAAATEAGNVELADAEELIDNLRSKLAAESETHQQEHAEVLSRLERLELELKDATDKVSRAKLEAVEMLEAKKDEETRNAVLVKEQSQLKDELKDQERIIATFIGRMESLKAENSKLAEKIHERSTGRRGDVESRSPAGFHADQRQELHQQQELHNMYMDQVAELENQISYYQERVVQLEECALMWLNKYTPGNHFQEDDDQLVLEADTSLQLRAAKNLLAQYIDTERARELELGKWRKLYAASRIALSMVQNRDSIPSRETSCYKQKIEAAKAQQAAELAERHWYEIDSFERLMKAKDERMEALRSHLLSLEKQIKTKDSELQESRSALDAEVALRTDAEARLHETQQLLKSSSEELEKLNSRSTAPSVTKKRSRSLEESSIREVLESELHSKELKLAFVEAKLVQVQMQYDNERKSRESLISDVLKEKQMLENFFKDSLEGVQEFSIKTAIAAACMEVEKLSGKIVEAREQISNAGGTPVQATEASQLGEGLKKGQSELNARPDTKKVEKEASPGLAGSRSGTSKAKIRTNCWSEREEMADAGFAPILMKEQLQRYQCLLQRINELSAETETGTRTASSLNCFLQRSLELEKQVHSSGTKLLLIAPEDDANVQGPHLLKEHLTQIQKRLELKIANMINELRRRLDPGSQRPERLVRLRRSNTTGSNISARLLMQNQAQQAEIHR